MTKQELRREIRRQKQHYGGRFPEWSLQICQAIGQTPEWQVARTVLAYHALPDEPDLAPLFAAGDKQLLLPVVVGDDLVLRPYRGDASLQEGAFHILEPVGDDFPLERYADIGLVLVPGVAFDREGHRLGRGRGYYDRLLPRLPHAYRLGVCYPFQLLESVPHEPHDVAVEQVIGI
ncbi:MAG: 5-formyltetrahydrofolate cyclo-ligase [Bacteroidaceae bacterium]|nr:5-formyltetrahydrofolate cyclo-ligase [Bacteroidaceae bacterium]